MKQLSAFFLVTVLVAVLSLAAHARTPRGGVNNTAALATWYNVTPSGVVLTPPSSFSCSNYGTQSIQADTSNPSNVYTQFNCQGIWKSTDYGQTWTGPINTGTNGTLVGDCAGGITLSPNATPGGAPTIYESCIRENYTTGFWVSTDGGVDWTQYAVVPPMPSTQDVYAPVVDPYNSSHLLMCAHEQNYTLQSFNGGQTWSLVNLNSTQTSGTDNTAFIFFINTGNSTTTANTWLWVSQITGGTIGTWRTTNGGTSWTQVDTNEHSHGANQIYQVGTTGVVYMVGLYSAEGAGVLRSTDYGQTWTHYGSNNVGDGMTAIIGTSKNVYAGYGFPEEPISFEYAAQPGTGTWNQPTTPAGLSSGSAQFAIVNDGTHNILLGAMWDVGVWRYVEP